MAIVDKTIEVGQLDGSTDCLGVIPQENSLRKNFFWTFVANVVQAVCQLGLVLLLAKFSGPELVGKYLLGLAVTTPIFMFTSLQLRSVLATDVRDQFHFSHYLRLRLATVVITWLIAGCYALFSGASTEWRLILSMFFGIKGLELINDIFAGFFQRHERMDFCAVSQMLSSVLSTIAIVTAVAISQSLVVGLVVGGFSQLCVLLAYILPSMVRFNGTWPSRDSLIKQTKAGTRNRNPRNDNASLIRQLCFYALPLAGTSLLGSLNVNAPRYFVSHYCGVAEVGIFGTLVALMVAGNTVVSALYNASTPRLAKHFNDREGREFWRLFSKLATIAGSIGLFGVSVALTTGKPLMSGIFGASFDKHADVLVWVMLAGCIAYLAGLIHVCLIAVRSLRAMFPLYFLSLTGTCISCLVFIPMWGLKGGAIALMVGKLPHITFGFIRVWQRVSEASLLNVPTATALHTHTSNRSRSPAVSSSALSTAEARR